MQDEIKGVLLSISSRLESLEMRLSESRSPPRLLKMEEAARLLAVGQTKLRELIRLGKLRVNYSTGRAKIPMSEIVRLTLVTEQPKTSPTMRPRMKLDSFQAKESGLTVAEAVRVALRRKR